MTSDWYDEMEKAEQEYDAREYELSQEYSRGYKQGSVYGLCVFIYRMSEKLKHLKVELMNWKELFI